MQGATARVEQEKQITLDFNPRSLCRERPRSQIFERSFIIFQSTLPMQGATFALVESDNMELISIHAPYAGSDTAPKP